MAIDVRMIRRGIPKLFQKSVRLCLHKKSTTTHAVLFLFSQKLQSLIRIQRINLSVIHTELFFQNFSRMLTECRRRSIDGARSF